MVSSKKQDFCVKYGIVCSKYNYKQSEIEKEDGWMVYDFEGIDIGIAINHSQIFSLTRAGR